MRTAIIAAALIVLGAVASCVLAGGSRGQHAGAALLTSRARGPGDAGSKPNGLGVLSGVYDALVFEGNPSDGGYYHCMVRIDHDSVTNAVKSASQCYADVNLSDPHAEPREDLPGEGPDLLPGPQPPPPYNWQPPAEGAGSYDPGAPDQRLTVYNCYPGLGGSLGPNAITHLDVDIPEQQLAANGLMEGQLLLYQRQGSAQCDAAAPAGQPTDAWQIRLYPVDDVNGAGPDNPAPWRTIGDHDFDGDGCPDADELWTVKAAVAACGDDPYSALDLSAASPDVSGSYLLVVRAGDADACWDGVFGVPAASCAGGDGTIVPGVYHTCLLDVQQTGKSRHGAHLLLHRFDVSRRQPTGRRREDMSARLGGLLRRWARRRRAARPYREAGRPD